jgi:hypothetical protein
MGAAKTCCVYLSNLMYKRSPCIVERACGRFLFILAPFHEHWVGYQMYLSWVQFKNYQALFYLSCLQQDLDLGSSADFGATSHFKGKHDSDGGCA